MAGSLKNSVVLLALMGLALLLMFDRMSHVTSVALGNPGELEEFPRAMEERSPSVTRERVKREFFHSCIVHCRRNNNDTDHPAYSECVGNCPF